MLMQRLVVYIFRPTCFTLIGLKNEWRGALELKSHLSHVIQLCPVLTSKHFKSVLILVNEH